MCTAGVVIEKRGTGHSRRAVGFIGLRGRPPSAFHFPLAREAANRSSSAAGRRLVGQIAHAALGSDVAMTDAAAAAGQPRFHAEVDNGLVAERLGAVAEQALIDAVERVLETAVAVRETALGALRAASA